MLETSHVAYRYRDGEVVLRDVSFVVEERERVVLLGANGSGKTTLLRVLNGLLFPQEGTWSYKGVTISKRKLAEREWGRQFRREVVLLFQQPEAMLFNPTVYDEIAFGLRQLGRNDVEAEARHWAAQLGIEDQLQRPAFQLSGGQKQKVCLAALLALQPQVLLLDEPTANLDPRSTGWLIDFLQELDVTVVATTHNLDLAGELGDRVLVLSERGELIFDGRLEDVLRDEETLLAANLVHSHRHRHGRDLHRHFHVHDWS